MSILDLANALMDRGDVRLRGIGPAGTRIPDAPFHPPMQISRVPVPYQLLYDIWHYSPFLSPANIRGGADLVHATAATVPSSKGLPLVVTVHDTFPLSAPEQFKRRGVRILTKGIEMARRRADLVCCPSVDTLNDLIDAGFDEDRIRVVPWGARHLETNAEDRAAVRKQYQLNRRFILWVGTVEPRKNLSTLLAAFAEMQDTDVDLVIVGPKGWNEELDKHVKPVADRVIRPGFVPDWALAALYAEAAVFAMPSLREGFGLPLLDAMAQGAPVVVSEGTALDSLASTAGIAVDATDPSAWAEALSSVLGDTPMAKRMSIDSLARSKDFTWRSTADQMMSVYRELVP